MAADREAWRRLVLEPRPQLGVPAAAVLLAVAWAVAYLAGGSRTAAPHAFYVPIVAGAVLLPWAWSLGVAVVAGLLAGPLLPLSVEAGTAQPTANWLARLAFFVAIAGLSSFGARLMRRAWKAEHDLVQREREIVEQRTAIIRSVSHEFRTPLTVIKGTTEILHHRELPTEQRQRLLASLDRSSTRLEELVTVVTAAAQPLEDGERAPGWPTDLELLMRDVVQALWVREGPERVKVAVSPQVGQVATNPDYLRIALRCLVDNALKFSPPNEPVTVTAMRTLEHVVVAVRDFGPGIPEEMTAATEDPFRQRDDSTTRPAGGLGIGLYTARRLVTRLGGELRFDWPEGGGTAVRVVLPQRRERDRDLEGDALAAQTQEAARHRAS